MDTDFLFKLPDIGEGVAEGEVVTWHVKPGDAITEDAPLLEVMTDKVTAEIPSPVTGHVAEILAEVGQVVKVGQALVRFSAQPGSPDRSDTQASASKNASTPEAQPEQAASALQPDQAAFATQANAAEGPELADAADTQAAIQVSAQAPVQAPVQEANLQASDSPKRDKAPDATPVASPSAQGGLAPKATPAVRKLAREKQVDLYALVGSGEGGRITAEDVLQAAARPQPSLYEAAPEKPLSSSVVVPAYDASRAVPSATAAGKMPNTAAARALDTPEPLSPMRKRIASHLSLAKQQAPHFTLVESIDLTALAALRKQLKPIAKAEGWQLSFLPLIIKALSLVYPVFPDFNATFDQASQMLTRHSDLNLGVAVDIAEGLVVPVLPVAQRLTLRQLAESIADLAARARAGQLSSAQMQHGTLTLTNIGAIGGLFGTPILNLPQVAIIGLGKIEPRAVAMDESTIAVRTMAYVSVTCDHRIIDGATAARFLNALKQALEAPERLMLA
ncbi:MAG: dihydrolipoamide acetyltransferase family protein [Vampirovibrionales bacterium]|nr:dihydrolipoamide acetyltransferase family protein [Vampirovibrionales bacterium]